VGKLTCQEFVELVTAYLDGALDAETERRFAEHLTLCQACEPYFDQFRRTIDLLGHLPAESLPDHLRQAALAAFRDWQGHHPHTQPSDHPDSERPP
jgi:anti-sigma factor RsiW